jgi:hypothetical protein
MPQNMSAEQRRRNMEPIYHDWDRALSENDAEALLQQYAKDAAIESPPIPHLLGKKEGVCRGHDEMRLFFEAVVARKPELRQYYRTGYLSDGKKKMMFEYPRAAAKGEQMDFVEVIELNDDGLIQYHKVYWGWRGFAVLQKNEYQRKAA